MLGEFMYHNPTTLYFGSQSLENLDRELPLYGPNVLFGLWRRFHQEKWHL